MGRLCERPGCSNVAAIAYGFDADRLLVWLAVRDPDGDRLRAGSLCTRHAEALIVPRGWTLDDRRDETPRLFGPAGRRPAARSRSRRRGAAGKEAVEQQLVLADADDEPVPTVAAVTGAESVDDPDVTQAIPWLPDVHADDDLGGTLAAESPLLARAFRGTDRPR